MVLMMVLADVRVLRASLSHITSSSIYLVIIVNKYGGLLVKTKTVMLLLFVLLWQASGICMNCLFLMFLIFRLSYLQYSYRFATAFVEIYLEQVLSNGTAYICQISLGLYAIYLTMIILLSHWLVATFTSLPIGTLVLISFVLTSCMSIALVELLSRNGITAKLLLGKI